MADPKLKNLFPAYPMLMTLRRVFQSVSGMMAALAT